jgi:hypothetical protein
VAGAISGTIQLKGDAMKVFISWSGPESNAIARGLRQFLPRVIQTVSPFMSQHDIEGGTLWLQTLLSELNESSNAIVCLTPTNLQAPWLNFEAGAIAKAIPPEHGQPRVFTYLWKVEPSDLKGPLVNFQGTKTERIATESMIKSLRKIAAPEFDPEIVAEAFDKNWEIMATAFAAAEKEHASNQTPDAAPRKPEEMQRELLDTVREIAKGQVRQQSQLDTITGYMPSFSALGAAAGVDQTRLMQWPNRSALLSALTDAKYVHPVHGGKYFYPEPTGVTPPPSSTASSTLPPDPH